MADFVTEMTTIDGSLDEVLAVLLDFGRYPTWARDIKAVEVLQTDDQGRGRVVRFRAAGMGQSTSYTLSYDHSQTNRLSWRLMKGDIARKLDGSYELAPVGERSTQVRYELEVELLLPLPGFVKRRTQSKIMHTALRELKARVEAGDR